MSQVSVKWQNVYRQGRHVVVTTPSGPWSPCDLRGTPPSDGLPCTTCQAVVQRLVEDMIPARTPE